MSQTDSAAAPKIIIVGAPAAGKDTEHKGEVRSYTPVHGRHASSGREGPDRARSNGKELYGRRPAGA